MGAGRAPSRPAPPYLMAPPIPPDPSPLTRRRLLVVVITEVLYAVATRVTLHYYDAFSGKAELIRTALRAVTIGVYWRILADLVRSSAPDLHRIRHPLVVVATGLLLSVPWLASDWYSLAAPIKALFAATSIVVGVREELLFRGMLQTLLARRFGLVGALAISNALFVVIHVGVVPASTLHFVGIFLVGCIFGLIYARTGSLALVMALHAIYDAAWAVAPVFAQPSPGWGAALLILAFVLTWQWARPWEQWAKPWEAR